MYRSKFEQRFHQANQNLEYEDVRIPYTITHYYTPDFHDIDTDTYIELKGLFTSADRTKILTVLKQWPNLKLILVFQNPNLRLSKKSKSTYWMWCEKHGIEWRSF